MDAQDSLRLTLLVAGGGVHPPLRFFGDISVTAGATMLKFSDFPKTKLGTFSENFKSITLPGLTPGHRKLGEPIREASHLGEDHDADVL